MAAKDNIGNMSVSPHIQTNQPFNQLISVQLDSGPSKDQQLQIRKRPREALFILPQMCHRDARNRLTVNLYTLLEDVTSAIKKVRVLCFDNDPFR